MDVEDTDAVVIGGGQAGLSAGYFLSRFGVRFATLDHSPRPGGAWQFRWPTLTLAAANHVHDLPGLGLQDALGTDCDELPAAAAVSEYFAMYEKKFGIAVRRPVDVRSVNRNTFGGNGFTVTTTGGPDIRTSTVINATGTWDRPFIPYVTGIERFQGRSMHTHDYRDPHDFDDQRVLIVGAGISAVQLLIEISRTARSATTFWCSRSEPRFTDDPFTPEQGREAVARVERRVRQGLPPGSVVSVTGLPRTADVRAAQADGLMMWRPMFDSVGETGVHWHSGESIDIDVILWCTGFRAALDHLAPLGLREPGGGIVMTGRLATVVASDRRIQLLGYGPSASTIGANRAGREAARHAVKILRDSQR